MCGLRYEKFRSPEVPSFQSAYEIVLQSSRDAHERGDYSRNAYVGTVLGYMRLVKQGAWAEHIHWCCAQYDADQNDNVPF